MMKKVLVVLIVLALLLVAVASTVAQGAPAAHGVDGRTFGKAVSGLAQTNPQALAAHVSGCRCTAFVRSQVPLCRLGSAWLLSLVSSPVSRGGR